jgi:hypothetical protein
MAESRARGQRQLQRMVGDLGRAKVAPTKHDTVIYKVSCTVCRDWSGRTYRSGHPNGYADALERWTLHLAYAHPDAEAPCLTLLPGIKAARKERRKRDEREQQDFSRWRQASFDAKVSRFAGHLEAQSLADQIVRD